MVGDNARLLAIAIWLSALGILAGLTGCSSQGPSEVSRETRGGDPVQVSPLPDTDLSPVPDPEPLPVPMPATLKDDELEGLILALVRTEQNAVQIRRKDLTGWPGERRESTSPADWEQAVARFGAIKAKLAALSTDGLDTHALIQNVDQEGRMRAWLILPDGGVVGGTSTEKYDGLDALQDGLNVTRRALSRAPKLRNSEGETGAAPNASRSDTTPIEPAKNQRDHALEQTAKQLLPGNIRQALAAQNGRLLIVPVRDTGTAPYAALPLANGPAVMRWSFVVMPDIEDLTEPGRVFDMTAIDLSKAVIVGDPDLSEDPKWTFVKLPGAREEAIAVQKLLNIDSRNVLIGGDATNERVLRAINRDDEIGMVYLASHAIADPDNPLTRGFVALKGDHLYPGHVRTTQFRGWDTHDPLVVLSACQTALGRTFEGGGYGLARTWRTAGAGQVVASLWNVNDYATQLLMTGFVERLIQGQSPEVAMQGAQRAVLPKYENDPSAWASFTVYGPPTANAAPAN